MTIKKISERHVRNGAIKLFTENGYTVSPEYHVPGTQKRIDLLIVNHATGEIIIGECKSRVTTVVQVIRQVQGYCRLLGIAEAIPTLIVPPNVLTANQIHKLRSAMQIVEVVPMTMMEFNSQTTRCLPINLLQKAAIVSTCRPEGSRARIEPYEPFVMPDSEWLK